MRLELLKDMTWKLWISLRNVALFFMISVIAASGFASHGTKKMRTPRSGIIVHTLSRADAKLNSNMQIAKLWAERLDEQVPQIMEVSSMGRVDRWLKKKDFDAMKMEYSKNMMSHLKAMTLLFTAHRQSRGFQKLREFDFQNMIRKSDYLLSLYVTKESFSAADQKGWGEEIRQVLDLYNRERMQYDQKMITIAGG